MRGLIISDNHGNVSNIEKVINKVGNIEFLIHLGDFGGKEDYIQAISPCETYFVSGNNEYFSDLSNEKIIEIKGYKILLTHGHNYSVNYGDEKLLKKAREEGINVVMHGHTHIPKINHYDSIWIINPGSIALPRQADYRPSYIIMDIDVKNNIHFTINKL